MWHDDESDSMGENFESEVKSMSVLRRRGIGD
jgi:hypothetical protein